MFYYSVRDYCWSERSKIVLHISHHIMWPKGVKQCTTLLQHTIF